MTWQQQFGRTRVALFTMVVQNVPQHAEIALQSAAITGSTASTTRVSSATTARAIPLLLCKGCHWDLLSMQLADKGCSDVQLQ